MPGLKTGGVSRKFGKNGRKQVYMSMDLMRKRPGRPADGQKNGKKVQHKAPRINPAFFRGLRQIGHVAHPWQAVTARAMIANGNDDGVGIMLHDELCHYFKLVPRLLIKRRILFRPDVFPVIRKFRMFSAESDDAECRAGVIPSLEHGLDGAVNFAEILFLPHCDIKWIGYAEKSAQPAA